MSSLDRTNPAERAADAKFNRWQLLTVLAWIMLGVACAVPPWALLAGPVGVGRAWIFFLLVGLASFGLAALMGWLKFKPNPERVALITLLFLVLLLGLRWLVFRDSSPSLLGVIPEFLNAIGDSEHLLASLASIAAIAFLWWRGIAGWSRWIGPLVVRRSLQQGIVIFLLVGVMAAAGQSPLPLAAFFIFLFSGLLAMGGARLSAQAHLRGGRGVPFQRTWLLGVGGTALVLLAISAAASALAGGPLADLLAYLLSGALRGAAGILLVLLEPIVYIITQIWNLLLNRIGLNPARLAEVPSLSITEQVQEQVELLGQEVAPPAWAGDVGRLLVWAAAGLGIVLAVLVIAALLKCRGGGRQWRTSPEDARHGPGSVLNALRDLLRPGLHAGRPGGRLHPARRLIAAARIRMIYLQLLQALAKHELRREPSETPLEYLARLQVELPRAAADLKVITDAYLRVRYGELPEHEAEIRLVDESWGHVRQVLRQVKKGPEVQVAS